MSLTTVTSVDATPAAMHQALGARRMNKTQLKDRLLRIEREIEHLSESLARHLMKEPEDVDALCVRHQLAQCEGHIAEAVHSVES